MSLKVCRLILLGDLGGSCETLIYHNPGHVFRIRFFSTPAFLCGSFLKQLPSPKKTDFLPSVESLLLRRGVAIPQSMLVNWVPEKNQHANPETGPPTRPYRQLGCDVSEGKYVMNYVYQRPSNKCQLNHYIRNDPFLPCIYHISIHFSTL